MRPLRQACLWPLPEARFSNILKRMQAPNSITEGFQCARPAGRRLCSQEGTEGNAFRSSISQEQAWRRQLPLGPFDRSRIGLQGVPFLYRRLARGFVTEAHGGFGQRGHRFRSAAGTKWSAIWN